MRIDVESEFTNCVRKIDGIVSDDIFRGTDNAPKNADYWFPKYRVIAELKCLSDNLMTSSEFNRRASALYNTWVKRGDVARPADAKIKFKLKDLPKRCVREIVDPLKRRLETNTLKKANNQIKHLRKHLGEPSAKGLLILVNDGDYSYTPAMMSHLLARSLKVHYSSINSVIYLSVNESVKVPGMAEPMFFWANFVLPNREPISQNLYGELKTSWMSHYSGLVPNQSVSEYEMESDSSIIDNIEFRK